MIKPKKILLACVVGFVMLVIGIIVADRMRIHEAEQVKMDYQLHEFASRYGHGTWIIVDRGVPTDVIRVPFLLPVVVREFRWHWDDAQGGLVMDSEIVFAWPR